MPNTRGLHSQALDLLRFPLAVIIVIAHTIPILTYGEPFFGKPYTFSNFPICNIVFNLFFAFFRRQSVPIYFFIAGYVFFLGAEPFSKEVYIRKIRNRITTLLIPYLVWNSIGIICFILSNLHTVFSSRFSFHWFLSAYWVYDGNYLIGATGGGGTEPIILPLWFLRNLMVVALASPLIFIVIKRVKFWSIILLGIVWFSIRVFLPSPNLWNSFTTAFFFFSWGAYMSIHKINMVEKFGQFFKETIILYLTIGILFILLTYIHPEAANIVKQLNYIVGPPFAYNISVWLLKNGYCKVNRNLAATGFFIYASHILILRKIWAYLSHYPSTDIGIMLMICLTISLTIGILLVVYSILKRIAPSLLTLLTGKK